MQLNCHMKIPRISLLWDLMLKRPSSSLTLSSLGRIIVWSPLSSLYYLNFLAGNVQLFTKTWLEFKSVSPSIKWKEYLDLGTAMLSVKSAFLPSRQAHPFQRHSLSSLEMPSCHVWSHVPLIKWVFKSCASKNTKFHCMSRIHISGWREMSLQESECQSRLWCIPVSSQHFKELKQKCLQAMKTLLSTSLTLKSRSRIRCSSENACSLNDFYPCNSIITDQQTCLFWRLCHGWGAPWEGRRL